MTLRRASIVLAGWYLRRSSSDGPDVENLPGLNGDARVLDHVTMRVHRHHSAVVDQNVDATHVSAFIDFARAIVAAAAARLFLRVSPMTCGRLQDGMQAEHLPGVLGLLLCPLHEIVFVDSEDLAIFHQDFALDHHGLHVSCRVRDARAATSPSTSE